MGRAGASNTERAPNQSRLDLRQRWLQKKVSGSPLGCNPPISVSFSSHAPSLCA
jgi:hypothetical protein